MIVFDLGGTLMEYQGMPLSWINYYKSAFYFVKDSLRLPISEDDIEQSCKILTSYNPRVSLREVEYVPVNIFAEVTSHWKVDLDMNVIIREFFKGFALKPVVYEDTIQTLRGLREKGYQLAVLTDLPTAMPDEIFTEDIPQILDELDLYVSSLICGYRKPNKQGLIYIAEHFKVEIEQLAFVGDEEKDVKAAQNAGCMSIVIDRKKDKKIDEKIDEKIDKIDKKDKKHEFVLKITSLNELMNLF